MAGPISIHYACHKPIDQSEQIWQVIFGTLQTDFEFFIYKKERNAGIRAKSWKYGNGSHCGVMVKSSVS